MLTWLRRVARVDSVGAFLFAGVPTGRVTLRTRQVGYYRGEGTIVVEPTDSIQVEVGLDRLVFCMDCVGEQPPTPGYVRVIP